MDSGFTPWLTGPTFVLGTMAITWTIYALSRLCFGRYIGDQTPDLAGSVIFRVSALHGLILALVFAEELRGYGDLREALVREATAVADTWNEAWRYGDEAAALVQPALSDYLREAAGPEWRSLGTTSRLTPEGWALRQDAYLAVLDLVPETPRQVSLRDRMVDRLQVIAELRDEREVDAMHHLSPLFWVAAVSGVVLITLPYFVFVPSVLNLALLSIYGAYSGLIMYLIFAFSNPFVPPGDLGPDPFLRLLETAIGQR